jgi:predicted nucleic acid-binding Zn ribbon protein
MERSLGPEEMLRACWPAVVGSRLAATARLKSLRGSLLTVSVPDAAWQSSLDSLSSVILEAANKLFGKPLCAAVRFVIETMPAAPRELQKGSQTRPELAAPISADLILDAGVRESFSRSAAKYFARAPERMR